MFEIKHVQCKENNTFSDISKVEELGEKSIFEVGMLLTSQEFC